MLDSEPMIETTTTTRTERPPSRAFRTAVILLLVLIAAGIFAGVVIWGIDTRIKAASAVKEATQELATPTVVVIHPKPGAPKDEIVLPGNIQAFVDSPIYARASGYVKSWSADMGARVKTGQVLAEIEAPELDQQVNQAQATLEQSKAALEQALANQEQGKANEELARVTAQRWKELQTRGVVSRQENDQYQAQYQMQVANLQALEKAIAAARGNISSSEANLARLKELQGFKLVRAPFDGVITARNTDIGALINAGNGGSAQELFHIAAVDKLRVFVNVPQAYTRAAGPGIPADLTLAEFPGRHFRGKVVRTAEAIDPATRTLLTEVDIDNPTGELRPGAYAEVHLTLPQGARALMLPVSALLFRSEGLRVGVVRQNGKVELVPITLGRDYGNEVEVVSGLSEKDQVIANPPDSLTSGSVVRVISPQA